MLVVAAASRWWTTHRYWRTTSCLEKRLVPFNTLKELQELVPYYLNRPREREQIAQAGYARAHREHTFQHRLEKMFSIIAEQNGNFKT